MRRDVRFAQVLEALLNQKYKRNRAALASAANLSPSALSQYVRGKAAPSLPVLADLSDALDVSMDYLVFGREHPSSVVDPGYLIGHHLDEVKRQAQSDAAARYDLIARLGAYLAKMIDAAITEAIIPSADHIAGTLTPREAKLLERTSIHTTIVTSNLGAEVLVLSTSEARETAAPGVFGSVVIENIRNHNRYTYLIPAGQKLSRDASLFRQLVIEKGDLDSSVVDRHLRITQIPRACFPSYLIYAISLSEFRQTAAEIYDRVAPFLNNDSSEPGLVHIATLVPASGSYQQYALIDSALIPSLLQEVDDLKRAA
jgi:transcriptional regulator with XRE-family HTH domain